MGEQRTVAVIGANGLVGSRLVQVLVDQGATVRALVRNVVRAHHLRHPRCHVVRGDVTAPATLAPAMHGSDVAFQCAWAGGPPELARSVNVDGACNVIHAAAAAGVRRVVHLSTAAVHRHPLPSLVTEDLPLQLGGDSYGATKAAGEQGSLELGHTVGVEVVVVRPSVVYGPGSRRVLVPFQRVKDEDIALLRGDGLVNLVYIDDLVEGLLAAARAPSVAGEVFLLSGDRPVTWTDYIGSFARMCKKPSPPVLSARRARLQIAASRYYASLTRGPRWRRLTEGDLVLMAQRSTISIAKARARLGYAPRFSLHDGMEQSERWLRRAGYLPSNADRSPTAHRS